MVDPASPVTSAKPIRVFILDDHELVRRGLTDLGASPHANGGLVSRPLDLPNFHDFGVSVDSHGSERAESTRQLSSMLAEIYRQNPDRFRLFCPR